MVGVCGGRRTRPRNQRSKTMGWRVEYRMFRCHRETRDDVLDEATTFAAQISSELLIAISHALETEHTVATVWFWSEGSYWPCPRSGDSIEEQFDSCWGCSTPKPQVPSSTQRQKVQAEAPGSEAACWDISYRTTRGSWFEWDDFFSEVAKLASAIGPERLVGIAHSGSKNDALATVFYWSEKEEPGGAKEAHA